MVFRITNYCTQACTHCMQDSTPDGEHASMEVVDKMIQFAKLAPRTTTISLSGGEPLSHPEFLTILDKILLAFSKDEKGEELTLPITIITNGEMFIGLKDNLKKKTLKKEIISRLLKHKYLLMQITTIEGIYPGHKSRLKKIIKGVSKLKKKGIFDRTGIVVCTDIPHGIIPIGRAIDNEEKLSEVSFIAQRKSPSCFNMYTSLSEHNGNFFKAIDYVKTHSMASFCKPMIMETGEVKFGEYGACTTVIDLAEISIENMYEMLNMSVDISQVPGPCRKCVNNDGMTSVIDQYLYKFKDSRDVGDLGLLEAPVIDTEASHVDTCTNVFKQLSRKET